MRVLSHPPLVHAPAHTRSVATANYYPQGGNRHQPGQRPAALKHQCMPSCRRHHPHHPRPPRHGQADCRPSRCVPPCPWRVLTPVVGDVTISNDGATIMKLLDIVHPAAKTLVDIARSQDAEVCARCLCGGADGYAGWRRNDECRLDGWRAAQGDSTVD